MEKKLAAELKFDEEETKEKPKASNRVPVKKAVSEVKKASKETSQKDDVA